MFLTYEPAPPQPERFVDASGAPLMAADDMVFAVAALLMAWDFVVKLGPLYPRFVEQITRRPIGNR